MTLGLVLLVAAATTRGGAQRKAKNTRGVDKVQATHCESPPKLKLFSLNSG